MILLHRLKAVNFKQLANVDLTFPESGSVLIEGDNEAGKSSLFEAVYFALYGDSLNGVKNGELIRYGEPAFEVELEFSVGERRFTVRRRQGNNQTAWLDVPREDGGTVRVNTVSGVNQQIVKEVGISGKTLLNSCFVEQKQLGKLDSMDPRERETAMNELLDLKAFTDIERTLPRPKEDKDAVEAAKRRYEIADLDNDHGHLAERAEGAERHHAATVLFDIANRNEKATHVLETACENRDALNRVVALSCAEEASRILREGPLALWETAEVNWITAFENEKKAQKAKSTLQGKSTAADRLNNLRKQLELLVAIEAEDDRYADWEEKNERAVAEKDAAEQAWMDAKNHLAAVTRARQAAERRDALTSWAIAYEEWHRMSQPGPDLAGKELARLVEEAAGYVTTAKADEERATNAVTETEAVERRLTPPTPPTESPTFTPAPIPGYVLAGMGGLVAVAGPVAFRPALFALIVIGLALFLAGAFLVWRVMIAGRDTAEKELARRQQADAEQRAYVEQVTTARTAVTAVRAALDAAREHREGMEQAYNEAVTALKVHQAGQYHTAILEAKLKTLNERADALTRLELSVPVDASAARKQAEVCAGEIVEMGFAAEAPLATLHAAVTVATDAEDKVNQRYLEYLRAITKYQPARETTDAERERCRGIRDELMVEGLPVTLSELKEKENEAVLDLRETQSLARTLPDRKEDTRKASEAVAARKAAFTEGYTALPIPEPSDLPPF